MLERFKKEEGFTLIEILAALLIMAIVGLAMTAYFNNAMSYAKTNQNKTIMSNLARNALVYMEKQNFERIEDYFKWKIATEPGKPAAIEASMFDECTDVSNGVCAYQDMFGSVVKFNAERFKQMLSPQVNGVDYQIRVTYQPDIRTDLEDAASLGTAGAGLLLPISVTISGPGGPRGSEDSVTVEGYINADQIR